MTLEHMLTRFKMALEHIFASCSMTVDHFLRRPQGDLSLEMRATIQFTMDLAIKQASFF